MTLHLARLASDPPTDPAERRREERQPVWAVAILQSAHGDRAEASLIDLSSHGCAVAADAPWLRPGGFVSIRRDDRPALRAIVRWIRKGAAGMEFLGPIPAERREWHALLDGPLA